MPLQGLNRRRRSGALLEVLGSAPESSLKDLTTLPYDPKSGPLLNAAQPHTATPNSYLATMLPHNTARHSSVAQTAPAYTTREVILEAI